MLPWPLQSWPSRSGELALREPGEPEKGFPLMKDHSHSRFSPRSAAAPRWARRPRRALSRAWHGAVLDLLIDEHDLTFTQPDATPIQQRTPAVIHGFAGEILPDAADQCEHRPRQVQRRDERRVYPDKVQVTVDGRRFEGCGGL